jgi:hypothetical protein
MSAGLFDEIQDSYLLPVFTSERFSRKNSEFTRDNIFDFIHRVEGFLQISRNGYFEHSVVGLLIGGLISYLVFEKTNHKLKSIVFGMSLAFLIGLAKEYIDPLFGGNKDKFDLMYTVLGSIVGVVIFLLFESFNQKKNNPI